MMSPHAGLPTSPTPSASAISPTLRGFLKWSMTISLYIFTPCDYELLLLSCGLGFRCFLIQRRHVSQLLNDLWQHLHDHFYIVICIVLAECEKERSLRSSCVNSHGQHDVRDFQRSGDARRATRNLYTFHVQEEQHGLSFNILHSEAGIAGEARGGMAYQVNFLYRSG